MAQLLRGRVEELCAESYGAYPKTSRSSSVVPGKHHRCVTATVSPALDSLFAGDSNCAWCVVRIACPLPVASCQLPQSCPTSDLRPLPARTPFPWVALACSNLYRRNDSTVYARPLQTGPGNILRMPACQELLGKGSPDVPVYQFIGSGLAELAELSAAGGQRSEARGQGSEVRGQRSGGRGQGAGGRATGGRATEDRVVLGASCFVSSPNH